MKWTTQARSDSETSVCNTDTFAGQCHLSLFDVADKSVGIELERSPIRQNSDASVSASEVSRLQLPFCRQRQDLRSHDPMPDNA